MNRRRKTYPGYRNAAPIPRGTPRRKYGRACVDGASRRRARKITHIPGPAPLRPEPRAALHQGRVAFAGRRFRVRAELPAPPGVPVLVSALRPGAYALAGRLADGALAWVCPLPYLRDQALPALRAGAAAA